MLDINGRAINVGETVIFSDSNKTNLVKGFVTAINEKTISIDRIGRGWPLHIYRKPGHVVVIDSRFTPT